MRYGLMLDVSHPIARISEEVREAKDQGLAEVWCSQIFGYDALTLLAVIGGEVPGIGVGTAVVPVYPRHPTMLAAQALTVQAATGNRLTLGIGLSHQVVIEGMFGYSFDRPYAYMAEYVAALMPLLGGQGGQWRGERLTAVTLGPLQIPEAEPPRVLIAALGTKMLELAGRECDGTITWMTGPSTIGNHVAPTIGRAAEAAGRSDPVVAVGLPVCVTDDPDGAREQADKAFAIYGQLPSYRAMLDREGAAGPGSVAVVGDEASVARQLQGLEEAGATAFVAAPFGSPEERRRTTGLLSQLATG